MVEVGAEPFLGLVALEELVDERLEVLSDHGAIMDDVLGLNKVKAVMERCRSELHAHLIGDFVKWHEVGGIEILNRHAKTHVRMLKFDKLLKSRVTSLISVRYTSDRIVGLPQTLNRNANTNFGKLLTQLDDAVSEETIGGNHDAIRLLVELAHNILEISANERLAARDVGEIHLRKLLDSLEGDLLVRTAGSLVAVAHGATSVAAIRNDDRAVEFLFCHE